MQPRVVGKVEITMLEDGTVRATCNLSGGAVQMLGMLEQAKLDLLAALRKQQADGIQVAPPGMSVLRNGG